MVRIGVRSSTGGVPAGSRRRRSSRPRVALVAASVAGVLTLGACAGEPELTAATGAPLPAPSVGGSPTPSPSPSSTLTSEEQEAFDQATAAALAFRQVIVDLYSGARTRINDLDSVATDPQLGKELPLVAKGVWGGTRVEPQGAELALVWARPERIKLAGDRWSVSLRACIDASPVTVIRQDGSESRGGRQVTTYKVVKTDYLPAPGWAVAKVSVASDPKDRVC